MNPARTGFHSQGQQDRAAQIGRVCKKYQNDFPKLDNFDWATPDLSLFVFSADLSSMMDL
jgi:hypothetical protein